MTDSRTLMFPVNFLATADVCDCRVACRVHYAEGAGREAGRHDVFECLGCGATVTRGDRDDFIASEPGAAW